MRQECRISFWVGFYEGSSFRLKNGGGGYRILTSPIFTKTASGPASETGAPPECRLAGCPQILPNPRASGHFQDPVVRAGGEIHLLHRLLQVATAGSRFEDILNVLGLAGRQVVFACHNVFAGPSFEF